MGNRTGLIALSPGVLFKLPDGTTITALPGVYSPHFFESGGKIKYYSKDDLLKALSIKDRVDILLTHEAPVGLGVLKKGQELGKEHINQLIEKLRPRVAFFGHHHQYHEANLGDTIVMGMDLPHHSYLKLNTQDFSTKKVTSTLEGKLGYRYNWETKP
jgi:hypothetical protein